MPPPLPPTPTHTHYHHYKAREDVLAQGQDSLRERDDFKHNYFSARARLQGLEDQVRAAV